MLRTRALGPPPMEDRLLGCLLGGALGDALGYPLEFIQSSREITDKFGSTPPQDLSYAAAEAIVSDDTQMTLFSAEAMIRARIADARAITPFALGAYQRWYATQAMTPAKPPPARPGHGLLLADPRLYARRAPGMTCLSALALSFTRPTAAGVEDPPNGSKGCGAVMRSAPFGLAAYCREDAFVTARDAAALTHGHPSGYLSAAYLAALVYDLTRGAPLDQAMHFADGLLTAERGHQELAAAIASARALAARGVVSARSIEALGGGWVGEEALAIAIACALGASEQGVAAALWRAVAHGGDSDSTGSVAGNLVGSVVGAAALPARWRMQLELEDLICRIAADLYAVTAGTGRPDPDAYPALDGVVRFVPGRA